MKTRITGPANSFYHVFSRILERRFYLGDKEKDAFYALLWRVAEFSGVKVVTYCILDNHFHLLIQIPDKIALSDDEILRRLKILYGREFKRNSPYDPVREFINSSEDPGLRTRLRKKYLRRMYNLSEFMRTLKLRYSFWFNRTHEREGTLWDSRFKSVLVEGDSANFGNLALVAVAAYIDLNCVRAGIVDDPKNYRWCGYAEAVAGGRGLQKGFESLYGCYAPEGRTVWEDVAVMYSSVLCAAGHGNRKPLSSVEILQCRIRYFTRGAVLGSRSFVENAFRDHRWMFSNSRKSGARKVRGVTFAELFAARDVGRAIKS